MERFETFKGHDNKWYWRWLVKEQVVAIGGQGYASSQGCRRSVKKINSKLMVKLPINPKTSKVTKVVDIKPTVKEPMKIRLRESKSVAKRLKTMAGEKKCACKCKAPKIITY